MPTPEYHRQQLAANFQLELNRLLSQELEWDENVLVTVLRVEASVDGQHLTAIISVLPVTQQEEVVQKLQRQAKDFSFQLGKLLGRRRTPELRFKLGQDPLTPVLDL